MKKIPLSQGKFAIVDDEDYEFLNQWKWYYMQGYAVRNDSAPKRGKIHMHRVILERMGFKDFEECDHVNQNGIDNRHSNLRSATRGQNQRNKGKLCNNTSGHTGVCWNRACMKWQVKIGVKGTHKYIGLFDDKEEAARAYDEAAKKYHGEFANLNMEE